MYSYNGTHRNVTNAKIIKVIFNCKIYERLSRFLKIKLQRYNSVNTKFIQVSLSTYGVEFTEKIIESWRYTEERKKRENEPLQLLLLIYYFFIISYERIKKQF